MTKEEEEEKKLVLAKVADLVANFLYYDRKEDEELPRGRIQTLIAEEKITVDEIVAEFAHELREHT